MGAEDTPVANLTFQQILRYALPGGVVLIVLLGVYAPPTGCEDKIESLGGPGLLLPAAFLVGCLIYVLHRATIWPVINRVFQLISPFRLNPRLPRSWCVIWPSKEEMDRAFLLWKTRKSDALTSLEEWATQIHYLVCSAWAIVIGHLFGWGLNWSADPSRCCLSWGVFLILLGIGIYHAARYQKF
jgi:hypothetical protein